MISITYPEGTHFPEGSRQLSKEELLLLQKACYQMCQDTKKTIYDLKVYYNHNSNLINTLMTEADQYEKLRILFEDLENLV